MQPLKVGACLKAAEIAEHRNWLFDDVRDIEIKDFMTQASLSADRADLIAATTTALDGHMGRLDIHGPFEGLDIDRPGPFKRHQLL